MASPAQLVPFEYVRLNQLDPARCGVSSSKIVAASTQARAAIDFRALGIGRNRTAGALAGPRGSI